MSRVLRVVLVVGLLGVFGLPVRAEEQASSFVVLSNGVAVPNGWREVRDENEINTPRPKINAMVALKRRNMDMVEAEVLKRSNPRDPSYGQWFDMESLRNLTSPSGDDVRRVQSWLMGCGVSSMDVNRNFDVISMSVEESVFRCVCGGVAFTTFQHFSSHKTLRRTVGEIRIPANVSDVVLAVVGGTGFPVESSLMMDKRSLMYNASITPAFLKHWYNVTDTGPVNRGNLKGVAAFQQQYVNQSDICAFYEAYTLGEGCLINKIVGHNDGDVAGLEASLDVEFMDGLSPHVPLNFYSFDGNDFCADLTNWTTVLLTSERPGFVQSISYGVQQASQMCDDNVRMLIDQNFMLLSGRGISIIVASGDDGSGWYARNGFNGKLVPSWPAESPWCTSVGATYFYEGYRPIEAATNLFGSGGGFSWENFSLPIWQQSTLNKFWSKYPASDLPAVGIYNPTGRGTPDVSVMGQGYTVIKNQQIFSGLMGTSASTPVFAGMVVRLNDYRLNQGKAPLGFLNPFLYQSAEVAETSPFNDIVIGTDKIGRNDVWGWDCVLGWDPVTGLGSPNFAALLELVRKLP